MANTNVRAASRASHYVRVVPTESVFAGTIGLGPASVELQLLSGLLAPEQMPNLVYGWAYLFKPPRESEHGPASPVSLTTYKWIPTRKPRKPLNLGFEDSQDTLVSLKKQDTLVGRCRFFFV